MEIAKKKRKGEEKRTTGGINYSMGMQMSIFYLGVAKEGRRALSSRQEQPPCGLWISCSKSGGKEKRTFSLCLFTWGEIKGREKKRSKKYSKYKNPHLSEDTAVIK